MEGLLLGKFVAAFVFVISLMVLISWGLKRAGLGGPVLKNVAGRRRLKLVEAMPLDHRRRLVIVSCDGREHLLVLGLEGETVVEAGIPAVTAGDETIVNFSRDPRNVKI